MRGVGIHGHPFDRRSDQHSVRAYVQEHILDLIDYVEDTYVDESVEMHVRDLLRQPHLARTCIENYVLPNDQKWRRIVDHYVKRGNGLTITLGRRRHWKTITTSDLVYAIHKRTRRPVYTIGLQDVSPPWMTPTISLMDVPGDAIVLWDETGQSAGARTSLNSDQRNLPSQLATAGHDNLLVFAIVQNSTLQDKSFPTFVDDVLVKPLSLTQMTTERSAFRTMLSYWGELLPQNKWESLLVSSDMNPWKFVRPIPSWWTHEYSRAFKRMSREDAIEWAVRLRRGGASWPTIATRLAGRGQQLGAQRWTDIVKERVGEDPARPEKNRAKREKSAA